MIIARQLFLAVKAYIHSLCGQRSHFSSKPGPGTLCQKCWVIGGEWQEE